MLDPLLKGHQTYVRRIETFLYLAGVFQSSAISPVKAYRSALLTAFTCFGMTCAVLNFCWVNIKSLSILTKGMSLACSLIATSLKVMCFVINRENLIELHETLKKLFKEELTHNPRTRSTLLSLLHSFNRPAYIYCFFVGGTLSVYFLPPIILIILQNVRHVEHKQYLLPFPATFPWPVEGGGFLYQIHFLYEFYVAWCLYVTNCGVDNLFGFYIFHIASLLKAMTFELNNPQPNENCVLLLRSCAKKYAKLKRCRDILQQVYGPIILWLVLTNGVVMCALIFQAFQSTDMTFGKAALFAFYMFLKLVQTFMYAWYGGFVTTESEKFLERLYFVDWMGENSKSIKNELIITMMQRPITIRALQFFFVSVDMFAKIINTTMSYFFLLQTLDESG